MCPDYTIVEEYELNGLNHTICKACKKENKYRKSNENTCVDNCDYGYETDSVKYICRYCTNAIFNGKCRDSCPFYTSKKANSTECIYLKNKCIVKCLMMEY